MAYTPWSVVANETPSTAKWNQLGANDAGFADGTNIRNNAIAARSLATNAITLGSASISSNFLTTSSTPVQITGMSSTVTIPAGGRNVEVEFFCTNVYNSNANTGVITIWDGTVNSGTQVAQTNIQGGGNSFNSFGVCKAFIPGAAAGSKTYNVALSFPGGGNSSGIGAATGQLAYMTVKAL